MHTHITHILEARPGQMDGWIHGWMDAWMDGCMDGWIHGWMDGWIDRYSLEGGQTGKCREIVRLKRGSGEVLRTVAHAMPFLVGLLLLADRQSFYEPF